MRVSASSPPVWPALTLSFSVISRVHSVFYCVGIVYLWHSIFRPGGGTGGELSGGQGCEREGFP